MEITIKGREFKPSKPNGYWRKVGIPSRGTGLYEALNKGLPYDVYSNLVSVTGLERKQVSSAARIPTASLARRAISGRFSKDESDRLFRFAEVFKAALELFEQDAEAAREWLNSPVKGLGNKKPINMLKTGAETAAVLTLINRAEHGVFS